jgi:hypothetical protein
VAGIEVLPFGFLVFVAATLLIATVWAVIDAKLAVSAAAREATRAAAESSSFEEAATLASRRAHDTMRAFGRGDDRVTVEPLLLGEPFGRCVRITVSVRYQLPAVIVPFVGGLGRLPPVRSSHTEIVDPFRSGVPGPLRC